MAEIERKWHRNIWPPGVRHVAAFEFGPVFKAGIEIT
jgi:hypothetical protein